MLLNTFERLINQPNEHRITDEGKFNHDRSRVILIKDENATEGAPSSTP